MHATIMDFANSFPFWDSLDSVRRIHSDLEGFALVFFALLVVSETLVHLSEDKKREKLFDTLGIIFFAVAVLAEISAYPYGKRDDTLSGQVIDSLDAKASDAAAKASKAVTDSSDAEKKSGDATDKAGKANTSSSNAVDLARSARTEADSFERDIVSAKTQAADAESYLADALQRVAAADAEIAAIKRPRRLSPEQQKEIGQKLSAFAGQKYAFMVFENAESLQFLKEIDAALQIAKWVRGDLTKTGIPGMGFTMPIPGAPCPERCRTIRTIGDIPGGSRLRYDLNPICCSTAPESNSEVLYEQDTGLEIRTPNQVPTGNAAIALEQELIGHGYPCEIFSESRYNLMGQMMVLIRVGEKPM